MSLAKLTMRKQRVLTLLLATLEGLLKKQTDVQQMYGRQSVELVTEILAKCLRHRKENFQIDQR